MPFCLCAGPPKVVGEEGVPEKPLAVTVDAPKVDANDKLATSKDDHLVTEDSWNTSTSPACPSEACTSTSQACFGQDQFFMQPLGSDLCGAEQLGWEPCSAGSLQGRHPSDYNTNPLLGNTRYKKLRDLGAGTYGFVLLAHDTKVGDMCAIKFLEVGKVAVDPAWGILSRIVVHHTTPHTARPHAWQDGGARDSQPPLLQRPPTHCPFPRDIPHATLPRDCDGVCSRWRPL